MLHNRFTGANKAFRVAISCASRQITNDIDHFRPALRIRRGVGHIQFKNFITSSSRRFAFQNGATNVATDISSLLIFQWGHES